MKLGITIVFLFFTATTWSADAPVYNNYYPDYAYGVNYNGYYQNSYYQPSYKQDTYSPENGYQQGYYPAPSYPAQGYGYYTPQSYQPPVYYAPVYTAPAYQDPYTYSNTYQGQTNTPKSNSNIEPAPASSPKTKPIKKSIIKTEYKAKNTIQLPKKILKKRSPSERNKQFLKQILPLVINENRQIQKNRTQLIAIFNELSQKQSISEQSSLWLKNIAKKYRVTGNIINNSDLQKDLLKRVNGIPPSMALAQAANESAWGTSRFSKQGNNLFGIWTYNEKIGIKPLKRAPGKTHFVRKFSSFQESVIVYIHTLNTHPAYKKLREIRHQAVLKNEKLSGFELAKGLEKYSARGQEYIKMIQLMIHSYDLENLALASLQHYHLNLNNTNNSELAIN